ncbi:DNA polymerase III subunit gamma/tau [Acetobacter oeni]|uniref:DNA polymerase III subunit gamma/tau n=1 Tax=Acetobacter oeni TaxID=304077 RepID=A0A511XGI6_9PROT|nr:DNA polymerase III subunit gamma/tau [Acetobacter oeni]MBB3881761.1 DNA polymerase-3 subunit gamma/tau [Acetobacter oeni]NHO17437.1 DNA polymerase III subunit gamma/tau [Acetobacter oeni]GBR01965.1 DNA polymerase III subunits gamma and tau [Acetobacter oeni LMG 21952]GEN62067.1 DNA polymerase III subunit gamma/tau [Acetobacter oeni]
MSDHESPADDLPLPDGGGPGLFGDEQSIILSDAIDRTEPADEEHAPLTKKQSATSDAGYRVLARKYRPATLDELIGQDALVRTLQNAFATGRVAHAFMLTGVRGVGKTTTARIIARGLNCTGADGKGQATAHPCGVCPNCVAILADRHPDVLEMDAASRTGVDDVRGIIEACHFRPIQGRMKVFIVDEVHMLSRNAFNALLKTLEEPPPQVTFIFATTELRKVPVTVLSRCQRFDLRRIAQSELVSFFTKIADREKVTVETEALKLIARAADGSVRDGLSLLDQAIAQSGSSNESGEVISASLVAAMLGLSDRSIVFDLFDAVMRGDISAAIALSDSVYDRGGDPGLMLRDLAELTHTVTRLKTVQNLQDALDLPESERIRGGAFASSLSLSALSRLWQMLLKGISEIDDAPLRREAAEMVLVRLCYASTLPSPPEILKRLEHGESAQDTRAPVALPSPLALSSGVQDVSERRTHASPGEPVSVSDPGDRLPHAINAGRAGSAQRAPVTDRMTVEDPPEKEPKSWRELVAFVKDNSREASLHGHLRYSVHLVTFAPPLIEVRTDNEAPKDLPRRLQDFLRARFAGEWIVREVDAPGELTLAEQSADIIQLHKRRSENHPLVKAILKAFPGAELGDIKDSSFDDHYGLPVEVDDPSGLVLDHDVPDPEDE